MTQIAEAYFHLKRFAVSEESLQSLGQEVSAIAANAAWGLFDPAREVEIRLESGSLKGWAAVIGLYLLGTYHGVAEYKDFKEGLREIAADAVTNARIYGDRVIEGVLKENKVPPKSVYRTERRTKTPGKLLRVLKRREWLAANKQWLSRADVERESVAIETLTLQVLADLPPDERTFVRDLLKGLDSPSDDDARSREPSQQTPPRLGGPHDAGIVQPELFGHYDLNEPAEREFYARFKLSEWHHRHLPRPTPDRSSLSPSAASPPRRDKGKHRLRTPQG